MPSNLPNSTDWDRSARRALATAKRRAAKSIPPPTPPKRPWISIFRLQHLIAEAKAQTLTEPNQEFSDEIKQELQEEWWLIVEDSVNVFWEKMRCENCGGHCGAKGVKRGFETWLEALRGEMDGVEAWEVKEEWAENWNSRLVGVENRILERRGGRCVADLERVEESPVELQLGNGAVDGGSVEEEVMVEESIEDELVMDQDHEFRRFAVVGSPVHSEVESSIYEEETDDEHVLDKDVSSVAGRERPEATKTVIGSESSKDRSLGNPKSPLDDVVGLFTIDELDEDEATEVSLGEGSEKVRVKRADGFQDDIVGQFNIEELEDDQIMDPPITDGGVARGEIDGFHGAVGQFILGELDGNVSTNVPMTGSRAQFENMEDFEAPALEGGEGAVIEKYDAGQVDEVDWDSLFGEVLNSIGEGNAGDVDPLFGDVDKARNDEDEGSIDSLFGGNGESIVEGNEEGEDDGMVEVDDADGESEESEEE